ncbi:hypothetical protein [Hymenobacter glacialis]|uniref:hypothetical protein n=1 Tax=Hymenobacter glacialis TaxID=1908236 RepID=UPI001300E752|nr:hypothetical protein [Hymenobacter glacialis]
MSLEHHAAYVALRAYLDSLLVATIDQAFSDVPVALRPNLAVFMAGRAVYQNRAG